MKNADILVFGTPVYYYEMAGQMKTLLDRANPLYPTDCRFRDIYLLISAAEDDATAPERAINGLRGWIECFKKARLAGVAFADGVTEEGAIRRKPELLNKACELGKGG